jgi:prepilin-type N-terminal cleavage/methylation domain-containing protein
MKRHESGFTLIEMLLSVVIISLLVSVSLPIYVSFQTRNDLEITAESIVSMLRRAQTYARSGNGDSQWGVEIQSSNATLFKGASFGTRDTSYDEATTIAGMAVSGLSEVVFAKLSAAPSITGSITLTANVNDTRTIAINGKGMVDY